MSAVARLRAAASAVPEHAFPVDRALAAAVLALLPLAEHAAHPRGSGGVPWTIYVVPVEDVESCAPALQAAADMLPEEGP